MKFIIAILSVTRKDYRQDQKNEHNMTNITWTYVYTRWRRRHETYKFIGSHIFHNEPVELHSPKEMIIPPSLRLIYTWQNKVVRFVTKILSSDDVIEFSH